MAVASFRFLPMSADVDEDFKDFCLDEYNTKSARENPHRGDGMRVPFTRPRKTGLPSISLGTVKDPVFAQIFCSAVTSDQCASSRTRSAW